MAYKNPDQQREYRKKWHAEHYNGEYAKKHRIEVRERKRSLQASLMEYKQALGCSMCGESEPCCLDFHHTGDDKKESDISQMPNKGLAWETILVEIAKCQVVCANCHRKIHAALIQR